MSINVLVLGSGGREHALSWKIAQGKRLGKLYAAPGNPGTNGLAENLPIAVGEFDKITEAIRDKKIDLLVIGPEEPLVKGLRDHLENQEDLKHLSIVGPGASGARLEGSKDFSKEFMIRHGIPTAASRTFTKETFEEGIEYLAKVKGPYVLKADGLAAGKGVVIAEDLKVAQKSLREMLVEGQFGAASEKVLVEQFLKGIELSVFVLTDGKDYVILPEAKDYKRIGVGDTGPNTGGMGAVSPVPFADESFMKKVRDKVVAPTISGLNKEGIDYKGFIFIGLMNMDGEPYVIEYNVRMGDPETQAVIPRIQSDFLELLYACGKGNLGGLSLEVDLKTAVTVVMVAGGYPGDYEKGHVISGVNNHPNGIIFHAGTTIKDGNLCSNGGRVLAITSVGKNIDEALTFSYGKIKDIYWKDCYYRSDIGQDLLKLL